MSAGLLEHIRTFVRTVETGSFTAVAVEQGQSQPTVSRQISALEDHLGVRLLQRTTRALTITDEGRTYYDHARALLDATEAAAMAIRPGITAVTGQLRIAAPMAFARLHLMPRMRQFLTQHPALTTDWVLGDRSVDLVEEGVDLAIRIGRVTDQSLIARHIGEMRRITVATPDYWLRNGRPTRPDELKTHDCIVYTGLATVDEWHFAGVDGSTAVVRVKGRVRVNASEGMRSAVLEGLGVAVVPTWLFTDEIDSGILQRVLTDYEPNPLPIQVVTPSRRLIPSRVRAFSDFLAAEFRSDPRLSKREPIIE
ncbi:LysR family transcriptional regulator [Mesorhizobium sp. B2-3-5]|uniref:LysR family transcriptional regulator n=1 Tax=Mesorhizobium sp. B2-3-5 TaxID=2589958 RepID=UPI00112B049C|nr:LysR family transcriptional regulator [Mesorhizobium sp. B2-3-5]TPM26887.1 LysR family transcriptional regulator [Mesorhizobium sp. B2-3-5]